MVEQTTVVGNGLVKIWDYDNIAIIVLMVCLLLSLSMNVMLVRGLLKIKDIINKLAIIINTLNERLNVNHG